MSLIQFQCSPEAQRRRRKRYFELIRGAVMPCLFEKEGRLNFSIGDQTGESRATLWIAGALLSLEELALANRLLNDVEWTPAFHYNSHFCGVACMVLLSRHGEQLDASVRQKLEAYVLLYLPDWMTLDFRIHGANDNAGIECASVVAWAGSYFENSSLIEFALKRFDLLLETLQSNDYIHECNSPTYSGVSLATLAELQECSSNEKIRRVALELERQVWKEVLGHFHPVIRHQIGPFSRAYPDDNAMQMTLVMMVMACALGEVSPVRPETMLFPPPPGTFSHSSWAFQWASLACLASATYHPPVDLVKHALERSTPFEISGRNEYSPMGVAPGGSSTVHGSVKKEWALSWFSNRPLCGAAAHIMYARRPLSAADSVMGYMQSVRALSTRCRVAEGLANFALREDSGETELVAPDHGVAFCAGTDGTLVMGYVPVHLQPGIRTVSASVIFPIHHSQPDEVWHGDQRVTGFSGSFAEVDWAFIREGRVFVGIRPLVVVKRDIQFAAQQYGCWGCHAALTVFSCASFAPQTFTQRELQTLGTGFVFEISSEDEGTFDCFRDRLRGAQLQDFQWGQQREIRYQRSGVAVELLYDNQFLTLRRAVARATGKDAER